MPAAQYGRHDRQGRDAGIAGNGIGGTCAGMPMKRIAQMPPPIARAPIASRAEAQARVPEFADSSGKLQEGIVPSAATRYDSRTSV